MKSLLVAMIATLSVLAACSHKPAAEPVAEQNTPAPYVRVPASQMSQSEAAFFGNNNQVSDKYGDIKVTWCGPDHWFIDIDPNKCGETMAKFPGRGCSEMAARPAGPLKHRWEGKRLLLADHEGTFSLIAGRNGTFQMVNPMGAPVGVVGAKRMTVDSNELSFICR
jgi:hypothetical protein